MLGQWRSDHQKEVETVERLIMETEDLDGETAEWLEKVNEIHSLERAATASSALAAARNVQR